MLDAAPLSLAPSISPSLVVWRQQPQQQNRTGPGAPPVVADGGGAPAASSDPAAQAAAAAAAAAGSASHVIPPAGAAPAGVNGGAPAVNGQQQTPAADDMTDPVVLRRLLEEARHESGGRRQEVQQTKAELAAEKSAREAAVKKAQADLTEQLGRALGFIKDDGAGKTPVTVEALTEQFGTKEQQYQQTVAGLQRKLALTAALAGAPAYVADAIAGAHVIDDLDPAAADFDTQVKARVDGYFERYPALRTPQLTAPLAGSSGGDFSGAASTPGGLRGQLEAELAEALKNRDGATSIRIKRSLAELPR